MKTKNRCPLCGQPAPLLPNTFGTVIKWARMRRQMTIQEFGKTVGVSASTIQRTEHGHVVTLAVFSRLCQQLKLDPTDWLAPLTRKGRR